MANTFETFVAFRTGRGGDPAREKRSLLAQTDLRSLWPIVSDRLLFLFFFSLFPGGRVVDRSGIRPPRRDGRANGKNRLQPWSAGTAVLITGHHTYRICRDEGSR